MKESLEHLKIIKDFHFSKLLIMKIDVYVKEYKCQHKSTGDISKINIKHRYSKNLLYCLFFIKERPFLAPHTVCDAYL